MTEEIDLTDPCIAIVQGWHQLLRDFSALPGQTLLEQAEFLIKRIKSASHLRKREEEAFNAGRAAVISAQGYSKADINIKYEYPEFIDYEEKRRGK